MRLARSVRGFSEGDLEKVLEEIKKPLIPPYHQSFKIPEFIKKYWISNKNDKLCFPTLRMHYSPWNISLGARFNAIVMSKKRKKGLKSPNRHHRVYQFLSKPNELSGHVVFEDSWSRTPVLEKGQVRKGMVYRFEVTKIDNQKGVFYCVPLAIRLDWQSIVNCKYKA